MAPLLLPPLSPFLTYLVLLSGLSLVAALYPTEIIALQDMQAEWGPQLDWYGTPSCSWAHLTCDANLNVVVLSLSSNFLKGTIPDSIGNLVYLQGLYMDRNALSGTIPASIGNIDAPILNKVRINDHVRMGLVLFPIR